MQLTHGFNFFPAYLEPSLGFEVSVS
ncbi:CRISPR-associated DxTHG motif protein [Acinetobacter halotolerans]|uniref:CRISPR-associated DxTHG motif protein n=1 Tax=Acinetobacter halotolerans TaxID=1752076 RepID=A0A4Q6XLH7_9GAMM|nr:CRISPR-associated DxTHG motif protein [Acinetobacter halotolerans]